MRGTEERRERMSDDFMEEEFERDRNEAFRLSELVEARCPWDVVCQMWENDGLHLVAQEMESADCVPKNTTEQIVRFDEEEQFVVKEIN